MLQQLSCLVTACEELGLSYRFLDENHNCVFVKKGGEELMFLNATTPFNSQALATLAEDKYFSYLACSPLLKMPKTDCYIDPLCTGEYRKYAKIKSLSKIALDIVSKYSLPCIIKRNRGYKGNNVFLCANAKEVSVAIQTIFNQQSKEYDYGLLAQEYIPIREEFRVIVINNKIELVYVKDISGATFNGNLSPLHWTGATSILVEDTEVIKECGAFLAPLFAKIHLPFAGLDIIRDKKGALVLIEMNTRPGFKYFIKDNGNHEVVRLYKTALEQELLQ